MTAPTLSRSPVRPKKIAANQKEKANNRSLPVPQDEDGFVWVLTENGWTEYMNKLREWQNETPRRFTRIFRWSLLDCAWIVMIYRFPRPIPAGEYACETIITGTPDEKRQIKMIHAVKVREFGRVLTYGTVA